MTPQKLMASYRLIGFTPLEICTLHSWCTSGQGNSEGRVGRRGCRTCTRGTHGIQGSTPCNILYPLWYGLHSDLASLLVRRAFKVHFTVRRETPMSPSAERITGNEHIRKPRLGFDTPFLAIPIPPPQQTVQGKDHPTWSMRRPELPAHTDKPPAPTSKSHRVCSALSTV